MNQHIDMPSRDSVVINEVGPRDGLQNQPQFVITDDKLRLIRALLDSGVRHIEATSFVSPKLVPQMADADELLSRIPQREEIDYSVLVPNLKGYDRAIATGARSIAVVLSCSDTMNRRNINMTLDRTVTVSSDVIKRASQDGMSARAYLAVAFECPFEGPISMDTVLSLADKVMAAGACEIIIADTIGAADPVSVYRRFHTLLHAFDKTQLSAHFHDTRGLGCANSFAALQAGIRKFDASIGGLGGCPFAPGAAGNVATEDLVHMFEAGGYSTGIDLDRLTEAISVAESCVGQELGGHWLSWKRSQQEASTSGGRQIG